MGRMQGPLVRSVSQRKRTLFIRSVGLAAAERPFLCSKLNSLGSVTPLCFEKQKSSLILDDCFYFELLYFFFLPSS